MNIAERIYETVKNMPEPQAAEVLEFAEYVKAKHPAPPSGQDLKNLLASMPNVGEDADFSRPGASTDSLRKQKPTPVLKPSVEEIMAIAQRFSSLPVLDARSDEGIIGYDDNGLSS